MTSGGRRVCAEIDCFEQMRSSFIRSKFHPVFLIDFLSGTCVAAVILYIAMSLWQSMESIQTSSKLRRVCFLWLGSQILPAHQTQDQQHAPYAPGHSSTSATTEFMHSSVTQCAVRSNQQEHRRPFQKIAWRYK